MGRPALSDAEKKARGTFDPRRSEEARGATIVPFPALLEIPPCMFPLESNGQKVYDDLTRVLFEQGRLTTASHLEVSALAGAVTSAHKKMADGKFVPVGVFQNIIDQVNKLQRAGVDRAFAGSSTEERPNKFGVNGFAARRRR